MTTANENRDKNNYVEFLEVFGCRQLPNTGPVSLRLYSSTPKSRIKRTFKGLRECSGRQTFFPWWYITENENLILLSCQSPLLVNESKWKQRRREQKQSRKRRKSCWYKIPHYISKDNIEKQNRKKWSLTTTGLNLWHLSCVHALGTCNRHL